MPSVESPSMKTTAMEPSAVRAAAMEEGMGSRKSSMAKTSMAGPAGGVGMPCRRRMQVTARVRRPMPAGTGQ